MLDFLVIRQLDSPMVRVTNNYQTSHQGHLEIIRPFGQDKHYELAFTIQLTNNMNHSSYLAPL